MATEVEVCGSGTLLQHTQRLLKDSEQTYSKIFVATGLEPNWLSGIASGRIKDPSVNRIQKLYEHLSGCKLFTQQD